MTYKINDGENRVDDIAAIALQDFEKGEILADSFLDDDEQTCLNSIFSLEGIYLNTLIPNLAEDSTLTTEGKKQLSEGCGTAFDQGSNQTVIDDSQKSSSYTQQDDCSDEENLADNLSFFEKLPLKDLARQSMTESEKNLIDEFYQKIEEVEKENDSESASSLNKIMEAVIRIKNVIYKYLKKVIKLKENDPECAESLDKIINALTHIKNVVDEYLKKGIKLNAFYDRDTVTNLVFEKINGVLDDNNHDNVGSMVAGNTPFSHQVDQDRCYEQEDGVVSIIQYIAGILLRKGGKVKRNLFYDSRICHSTIAFVGDSDQFDDYLDEKCKKIKTLLKDIVCQSIVKEGEQDRKDGLEVEMDNGYLYVKYLQDSIVIIAIVFDSKNNEDLKIRVSVLQIGESIVKVESVKETRNYTDIKNDIVLTFDVSLGKLKIRLYPDTQNKGLIKIEVRNQNMLEELKDRKEEIGKNCLLGGLSVCKAIDQGGFLRSGKKNSWVEREEIRRSSESGRAIR